jgi:hypothetical protein
MFKNAPPKSWFYKTAVTMPPLHHTVGATFDMEKSEVINWILAQPGIKQYLLDKLTHPGYIVYDKATGTWAGRDHKKPVISSSAQAEWDRRMAF